MWRKVRRNDEDYSRPNTVKEVFDFIEFLKVKLARQQSKRLLAKQETQARQQADGERMLQILENHGLLGCMEGDGELSENYKQHLWGNE